MNWAVLILIGLGLIGLGLHYGKHGESMGEYNGWIKLVAFIIEITLLLWAVGWSIM